jgi:hypothetical protein
MDSRNNNVAILARNSLNIAVLLNRILSSKIRDYDSFPLAHRLGFIHSLPEGDFDVASANITDVGFLGLFPKSLLQILYQYAREVDKSGHNKDKFLTLVNKLVTTFIYRPIIIQKNIQIMLSKMKNIIMEENHEIPTIDNNNESTEFASSESVGNTPYASQILSPQADIHVKRICHANKCCFLQAKGILRRPMYCIEGKNRCSGCVNESLRHRRISQIEHDILIDISANFILLPILDWTPMPISLKKIRKLFQHLPTFGRKKRDDHIFGPTRYLANTLGIIINEDNASDLIDQPMSIIEKR